MGACILCGKSAGPFYSLHKNCYRKYDQSKHELATLLCDGLSSDSASSLANKVNHYLADCDFTPEAQKRTLNRALEYFYNHHIDVKQLTSSDINAWLELLDELSLDSSLFVNSHFLTQQYNLHALKQLSDQCLPDSNRHPANYTIDMREQEVLWWCFDDGEIQQEVVPRDNREWSVITQLLDSVMNKRKKTLQTSSLAKGKLLVTNQRIYFESDDIKQELDHQQIYSYTPVNNGVRLQSKQANSTAQAYLCEDARLLYAYIQHARRDHQ